jgi:phosphatidylglycerol:prolipoprotein diacylglycerol transferase
MPRVPSPADPVAFAPFGVAVRWYALFILAGIVAAVWLIRALARRRGMDPDFPLDAAPWVVFAGIVGARAYYLLLRWGYYLDHPGQALNLRLGGLTIHGALAAGVVALALLCRRAGQRFLAWADLIIAGVALAQGIGRWGNWANQEAFGRPTGLPWGLEIDPHRRPAAYAAAERFHPTFLYESLFDLAHAALLAWLVVRLPRSRLLREGDVLWTYLVLYGIARFVIEGMRTDSLRIGPWPAAYWVSAALVGFGGAMLVLRHTLWPGRPADPVPADR